MGRLRAYTQPNPFLPARTQYLAANIMLDAYDLNNTVCMDEGLMANRTLLYVGT